MVQKSHEGSVKGGQAIAEDDSLTHQEGQHHISYGTDRMIDFERLPRRSVLRRKSFMEEFVNSDGPPQIVILMLLFAFGFGSVIGVVPAIMSDRYARINHGYSEDKHCTDYKPQEKPQACLDGSADAQNAVAIQNFISNGLTFFTSSLIGSLSDEYGRKGILLLGVFMATLSPLLLLLIQLHPTMSPIWYYTVGALQGLINWMAVALSALSDVMPPKWRAPSFGLVMAGFSIGFACAPQLALLLGHLHVTILSITVVLIAFVTTLLFFPETLPKQTAERARLSRETEVEGLVGREKLLWYLFRPLRELLILNRSKIFRLLSSLAFVSGISSSGTQALFLYYAEERLGFNDKDVASLFMIIGFCGIFVQGVVLKLLNDAIGERRVLILAFLVGALHEFLYSVARSKTLIFVSAALASLVMMSFPTISAIKANNVNETEQGRIQGALFSVSALAAAIGPAIFRFVYHFTKDGKLFGPGSMFLFSSFMYIAASVCAYLLPPEANSHSESDDITDDTSEGTGLLPPEANSHPEPDDTTDDTSEEEGTRAYVPLL